MFAAQILALAARHVATEPGTRRRSVCRLRHAAFELLLILLPLLFLLLLLLLLLPVGDAAVSGAADCGWTAADGGR